jgi:hypothetical protein
VVLVNEGVPAKSIQELVALAKANPGKLNHASGGTATLLALELFKAMAGVDITSIPFRGGAPAVTGVMSGDTQLIFADLATANAGMQSGKLRTLAVTTLKRAPRLPDVPTVDESGVPGYDVATWIGAFAPAGTPKSIVGRIEADIKQALAAPEVKAKLEALSMEIRSGASEEMRAVLAGDIGKWGRLVKDRTSRSRSDASHVASLRVCRLLRPLPRLRGRDRVGACSRRAHPFKQIPCKPALSPTLPRARGRERTEIAAPVLINSSILRYAKNRLA